MPLMETGNKTKEQILMESTILFAKNGYAALSMRELAEAIGIKPASLYNYFKSKKALWNAVLDHALELYQLYFDRMGEALSRAGSFEEALDIIFIEPKRMRNTFTCFAFSLIQTEQFRDRRAGQIFNDAFLEFSIGVIARSFDDCVAKKMAAPFDTKTAALVIMQSVMVALNLCVQETLGQETPYGYTEMLERVQNLILSIGQQPGLASEEQGFGCAG